MYVIELSNKSKKFLGKLSDKDSDMILNKIYSIKENPLRHLKKLQGDKFWRLRIEKFRVIVDVIISGKRIIVLRIDHRKKVYN